MVRFTRSVQHSARVPGDKFRKNIEQVLKLRVCWVPEAASKNGEFTSDWRMVIALAMVSQSD